MKEEDEIYVEQLRAYSPIACVCVPLTFPSFPVAAVAFAEKNKQEWDAEERRRREEDDRRRSDDEAADRRRRDDEYAERRRREDDDRRCTGLRFCLGATRVVVNTRV